MVEASDLAVSDRKSVIRVLHVDDDPNILEISKLLLMDTGNFEIDNASCVDEAFKKLSTGQYDVVISDYEMPQKNGLQFLKELKEQKNETPFILFTGKGREEVAIKALNLGADAYINKQGNPETVYGELTHAINMAIERKAAIWALKKNEAQLRAVVLNAPIGIAWANSGTFFQGANESFCRILGYSEKELRGLTFKDITHPDEVNESISKMQELISGCITFFSQEKRYIRKDGAEIKGKVTVCAIRDNEGKPTLFVAELEDITERKKTEDALIESEAKYRALINGMDESAWVINFHGNFIEVNDAAVKVLGYSKEELLSLGIKGIDSHLSMEEVQNLLIHSAAGETQVFETMHTAKDGTQIPVEISSSLINYQGKPAILAIARNITKRKKAEDALMKSQEEYRTLFSNMIDGFAYCQMVFDETGKPVDFVYLQVNDAFEQITGLKRDAIIGKKVSQAIPEIRETNPDKFF